MTPRTPTRSARLRSLPLRATALTQRAQRGMTLIELMVGIAIGLLVVAVAAAALMTSRGVTGTVGDASGIQQQAAYALRVIGLQLRQSGSLYLNLDPNRADPALPVSTVSNVPVMFEEAFQYVNPAPFGFDLRNAPQELLNGTDNTLTVGFRRHKDPVFTGTDPITLALNCLGTPTDIGPPTGAAGHLIVQSRFVLNGDQLMCQGNGALPEQPIVSNVANFQVRYLVQGGTPGDNIMQTVDAAAITNWGQVQGVQICLVLYGTEPIGLPVGSSYTDCDGTTSVNMTTLAAPRTNRMHLVFRNVFQLRSQGLM